MECKSADIEHGKGANGNDVMKDRIIPINTTVLTPETISAIEGKLGTIENVAVTDKRLFTIEIGGESYTDAVRKFFRRLAKFLFENERGSGWAKQYLFLRKKGMTHEEAKQVAIGKRWSRRANEYDPIPPEPHLISVELATCLENKFRKPIGDIAIGNNELFAFEFDGNLFQDKPMSLFYRIANYFLGGSTPSAGRYYLVLRKSGMEHEQAVIKTMQDVVRKPLKEMRSIFVNDETFSQELITQIEIAVGIPIEKWPLSPKAKTTFLIRVGGQQFEDTIQNLLYRIAYNFFKCSNPGAAKAYLAYRKCGLKHQEALQKVTDKMKSSMLPQKRKSRLTSLPATPEFITADVVNAIQTALQGRVLEKVSVNDQTLFNVCVVDKEYFDRAANLFERISVTLLDKKKKSTGRLYLILRRNGLTHEDAIAQILRKTGHTSRLKGIPVEPEFLNQKTVILIQDAIGSRIEDISIGNTEEFGIEISTDKRKDRPAYLFSRIAARYFKGSTSRARTYLALLRDGIRHEEAIVAASANGEVDKKARNKNPIPIHSSIITAELIEIMEKAISGSIDNVSLTDETEFDARIGDKNYTDRMRSFLIRIARTFFSIDNQYAARHYIILRKKGEDHENAVKLTQELLAQRAAAREKTRNGKKIEDVEITKTPPLPNPPEIEVQIARSFIDACNGKLNIKDTEKRVIIVNDRQYEDSPSGLLQRVLRKVFVGTKIIQAIRYITLIAEGRTHEDAAAQAIIEADAILPKLPNPPRLTSALARAFIESCGGILNYKDTVPKSVIVEGIQYSDVPRRFIHRVSSSIFGKKTNFGGAVYYAHLIAQGKSHEDAVRLARADNETRNAMLAGRLPLKPIEQWTREEVEQVLHGEIRHLRQEGVLLQIQSSDAEVTREEIDAVLRRQFYATNIVIRSVFDAMEYLQKQEQSSTSPDLA